MAIRPATHSDIENVLSCGEHCEAVQLGGIFAWPGLLDGDTGEAVRVPQTGVSLIANIPSGNLGAGGKVSWEGFSEGMASFLPLNAETEGDTPPRAEQATLNNPILLKERPEYIRPRVAAGDGTTDLVATLLVAVGRVDHPASVASLVGAALWQAETKRRSH
jgi:hypothetical protein